MPLRLDHDERRSRLVDAVWRIVERDGVRGASVRGVAAEAGLSMGSVRYFFTTQDELLRFAMRAVIERAQRRVEAGAASRVDAVDQGRVVDAAVDLLSQLLPLDTERAVEARVWAAFTGQALSDAGLAEIRAEADRGARQLCRQCLDGLATLGYLGAGRDLLLETERLHALIDGITIHLLSAPTRREISRVRPILRTHLDDLRRVASVQ